MLRCRREKSLLDWIRNGFAREAQAVDGIEKCRKREGGGL